ncbi:MAG: PhzF family phenazine biosynthesis protein, partial [Coriobacteriaceae bacterium]|nr:PhzF family phenazine biosynthesis protein [Coriobacteriaceae bacterium]
HLGKEVHWIWDDTTPGMASGDLFIGRRGDLIEMDFPRFALNEVPVTDEMEAAMGARPLEAYLDRDLLLVYGDEAVVRGMKPDLEQVAQFTCMGVAVTAPGSDHDCVSRFFAPQVAIDEDPVTGSVHCMIAPYWGARLGKQVISAYQASSRGGEMVCELRGERVAVLGRAALFASAELAI